MYNVRLIIAYDGGGYLGWQNNESGPSIEGVLQRVLEQILQHPVTLQAASRTDAGVHAVGQVVNLFTTKECKNFGAFKMSLNRLLPKDITVISAERAPLSFHPTVDSRFKEYRYYVCYGPSQLPHHRLFSWHYPCSFNLEEMEKCLPMFVGKHDFSAFCNAKGISSYKDFIREITEIEMQVIDQQRISIRIKGDHFLYKMVRNIVGTLVYVGRGIISKEAIPSILEGGSRTSIGMTAPAHGLFLHQVFY